MNVTPSLHSGQALNGSTTGRSLRQATSEGSLSPSNEIPWTVRPGQASLCWPHGAGGSYTEFYALDFTEDFVLMGHDGPGHVAISEGKPVLRGLGLYHGKRGYGISVEFNVKLGPITILGITQNAQGRLKMLAAEGESLPGPRLEIGNTNSRLRFSLDPAEFMNRWSAEGPTHHCALGVGHQLGKIEKVARLLGLELAIVG